MTAPLQIAALAGREDWDRPALTDAVLDSVDVGIVACDARGRLTVFNRVAREFHGLDADGSVGLAELAERFSLYRGDGSALLRADEVPLLRVLREGRVEDAEIVIAPPGVPSRLVSCTGRVIHSPQGGVAGAVVAMRDITAHRRAESALRDRALRDPLTGLANRSLLRERLEAALSALAAPAAPAAENPAGLALMFIDLDGFKPVNDEFGHDCGDTLLVRAARRIQSVVRSSDVVARMGGDEFVVLCSDLPPDSRDATCEVAVRVLGELGRAYPMAGKQVRLSASIGIAFAGGPHITAADLLRRADFAMYTAKHAGKARYVVYDADQAAATLSATRVERLVRTALDDDEVVVHYQPAYDLRTGLVCGVEALARIGDGDGGLVPPSEFVPVAESSGLIGRIGETVLRQALGHVGRWKAALPPEREFGVGVNLSVRELGEPGLVAGITTAIAESGVPADAVLLELTESIFSDSDEHVSVLDSLRALGVKIVIDDFGTGYSSLSYLRRFPVDCLKIDRSFVADLVAHERDRRITRAIVSMALDLGMPVVAEGIETSEQLHALTALGCKIGQGYLLARPLTADAMTALLAAEAASVAAAAVVPRSPRG